MTPSEWLAVGSFMALLIGVSLFSAKLAAYIGTFVVGVLALHYVAQKAGSA